ncbi:putative serine/threonine-protein kinase [Impatiens glandulifera]|uniref:putative serine/threonine-protein kinase n=1 Tax=Impatiens glandulifera TaxID=253017 RepID=UPI001FB0D2FF|nr:putative serine/threonine-protein kinase [Impatiens glandulifera]
MRLLGSLIKCFSPNLAAERISHTNPIDDNEKEFRTYSYNELKAASGGFRSSNKVGEGGFGCVYKGWFEDGSLLAIKVVAVEKESMRGEREFVAELAALSNIRHENLVKLLGCCIHGAERFLVYQHMENNSLSHTFLGGDQNRKKFSWKRRRNVVYGVAKALAYLHEEVHPHVVHRDIKTSNILLDHDFNPKLSDFGLAKIFTDNTSHISTRVAGTLGYLAPEYAISGHLTRKSDVYSFGVVILEVVSGQPIVDFDIEHGEQYLVNKAWEKYKEGNVVDLVDPILEGDFSKEEAVLLLKVGLLCVQETSTRRPQMSIAVKMLRNDFDMTNVEILRPGLVSDLSNVKIGGKKPFNHSLGGSTSVSSASPDFLFL